MQLLIVPVDGSSQSWRVVDVALELARQCGGRIEIVEVVFDPSTVDEAARRLGAGVHQRAIVDVDIITTVVPTEHSVADAICALVENRPMATVVMASQGKGRSAALLGSVAEDLLRHVDGPIVIVGPLAGVSDFSGPIIVTVDGSDTSEAALPVAAAWSLELGVTARVVQVVQPGPQARSEDEAYAESLAGLLATLSGRSAESQVLYDRDIEGAIAGYAASIGASLIVTSTHGRAGTSRFILGSSAAGFVRRAPCPVLTIRPKHFTPTERMSTS